MNRRRFLKAAASSVVASVVGPVVAVGEAARIVVVGGGVGGMAAVRELQQVGPRISVALVEPNPRYFFHPAANLVVAGLQHPDSAILSRRHAPDGSRHASGDFEIVRGRVGRIDSGRVVLEDGSVVPFDRAVVATGAALDFAQMPGYSQNDSETIPHAWTGTTGSAAAKQVAILRKQIQAVPDGGVFIILPPAGSHSCPPAPYERASLAADYFLRAKPRAKILVIDPKESFAKQALFSDAWRALYGEMIEWRGGEAGGIVEALNVRERVVETEFGAERGDAVNYIPPQRAGTALRESGLADASGWCPVRAGTFESRRVSGVHIVGDAAAVSPMPKAASAARSQGAVAAAAVLRSLGMEVEGERDGRKLTSACHSLAGPAYGLSSAATYRAGTDGVEKVGEVLSPREADAGRRKADADVAAEWRREIAGELFGGFI